jgi:ribosome-binding factor A
MGTRRQERVGELIREEISELIRREVRDPRLTGVISVTEVVTSPDLRHAKVYVSVMGTEEEKMQVEKGLVAASGFIRRNLGERLSLRYTPELSFHRDDSIERGSRLLQIIKEVTPNDTTDKADKS